MMCDYKAPETCPNAVELQAISGDSGTDTKLVTGTTSKWVKIFIREDSNFIHDPSYTATLESPPGVKFDLYSYVGDANAPDCAGNPLQGVGTPESLTESWNDAIGPDDNRWYTFEVRYVSGGTCDPSEKWKLTIAGNTVP
jgi:hypothetical protein